MKAAVNADKGYGLINQHPMDARDMGRMGAIRHGNYLLCLRATRDKWYLDTLWWYMQEMRKEARYLLVGP